MIRIRTLWGQRLDTYGDDFPELMVAWDEFCVDGNPEGYAEDKKKAIESWGDDLAAQREIVISVPTDQIEAAFRAPTIQGNVGTA